MTPRDSCTMSCLYPAIQMSRCKSIVGAVQRDEPDRLSAILREKKIFGYDDLAKALHLAAEKGYEQCARVLLDNHALPNIHDASGCTPVVIAARNGHLDLIKILISAQCNVNKPTFKIRATALHWAATNGHTSCVRALLHAGSNPEAQTIHGRTPLMLAARSGFEDVLWELLEYGANVDTRDYEGATALHFAAEDGGVECVKCLMKNKGDIDAQKKNGDTPVILAAKRGNMDTMHLLLKYNCDLEKRGHNMTVLHWAAEGGNADCLQTLLWEGIPIDVTTAEGYFGGHFIVNKGVTPLMVAAENGHSGVVKLLATRGAAIDLCDDEGYTALMYAARNNHPKCLNELLLAGANPNQGAIKTDANISTADLGTPPLFLAVKRNNIDIVKVLLRANCELNILGVGKEDELVTPLEYALSKGRIDIVRMLMLAGLELCVANPRVLEESLACIAQKDEEVFESLMKELRRPPSLMRVSRNCIRQVMGRRVINSWDVLPLPPLLKSYVALSDLDEF